MRHLRRHADCCPEQQMPARMKVSLVGYLVIVAGMLATGIVYCVWPRFLPYHAQAYGQRWEDVPERTQLLYLTAIRGIGAPTLVAGLAIGAILLVAWRRREPWALWSVPLLALAWGVPMLAVALWVHRSTGAATPWPVLVVFDAVICVSALLSWRHVACRSTGHDTQ
jgi:hypothetical protein